MPKVIEVIYEDGVFKPLKKLDLKDKSRVLIGIIDKGELDELLNSMVIEKIDDIDYRFS